MIMKNEKNDKAIGLWLDHVKAYFVDLNKGPAIVETLYSAKDTNLRIPGESGDGTHLGDGRSTNNEYHKHNRLQEQMDEYYKILVSRLEGYDDIYLFGPTTAKDELYNILRANKHFASKTINVEPAEQLTENQLVAKVKHFFNV